MPHINAAAGCKAQPQSSKTPRRYAMSVMLLLHASARMEASLQRTHVCLLCIRWSVYVLSLKSLLGRLYIHTSCVQVSSSQPRQQRRCAPLFQRSGMEVVVKISLRWKTLGKWDINGICAINQHHSIWRQKNKLK